MPRYLAVSCPLRPWSIQPKTQTSKAVAKIRSRRVASESTPPFVQGCKLDCLHRTLFWLGVFLWTWKGNSKDSGIEAQNLRALPFSRTAIPSTLIHPTFELFDVGLRRTHHSMFGSTSGDGPSDKAMTTPPLCTKKVPSARY